MSEKTIPAEERGKILIELPFDRTIHFLAKELKKKKRTPYLVLFFAGFVISFLCGIFLFLYLFRDTDFSIWQFILSFFLSFIFLILVTPLHELIHGITFRMKGATKVKYGVIWKSLAAYAVAVDYECNYKQFRFIALAPFVIISILLIILICTPALPPFWKALFYFGFLQHYTSCIGDILLVSYFYRLRNRNIITWDDIENRVSYFIEKKESI